jgi:hypothetical protein
MWNLQEDSRTAESFTRVLESGPRRLAGHVGRERMKLKDLIVGHRQVVAREHNKIGDLASSTIPMFSSQVVNAVLCDAAAPAG